MKNKKKRLLIVIALLISIVGIYTTYAIYKSTARGQVEVKAAAWVIKVNGTDIVEKDTFILDNITWDNSISGALEGTIAPGSVGTVDIEIDATGTEVPVNYEVSIGEVTVGDETIENSNFTISLVDDTATLSSDKQTISGHIAYSTEENAMKRTITLQIVWDIDDASIVDVTMAAKDIQIPVTVTATMGNNKVSYLYDVLKNSSLTQAYTGEHGDSMDASQSTETIYYWNGTSSNYKEILNSNNVVFGDYCWQIIRTTDTGGVKLLYSGEAIQTIENGKTSYTCSSTIGNIGESAVNPNNNSPAYEGYMYNTIYAFSSKLTSTKYVYGNSFTYSDGTYTLVNTQTKVGTNNHYTCWNATGTCSTISYIFYLSGTKANYIDISEGKGVEEALEEMLSSDDVNKTDSTIKAYIDSWYESNMTDYTDYLEDTIFCNDRSISSLGGWDPNGGSTSNYLTFESSSGLSCQNDTDKFSVSNEKAKLTYPVGLMTSNEINLLGYSSVSAAAAYYWLGSPYRFTSNYAYVRYVYFTGVIYSNLSDISNGGVRPSISLKPGITYTSGDGSLTNPYVIETN